MHHEWLEISIHVQLFPNMEVSLKALIKYITPTLEYVLL